MASREEIQALRDLAKKRHRAATAKVSRLKKTSDVQISGTSLDPRRSAGDIEKMRSRDLQAYVRKLNNFNSRETGWVHGAGKKQLLTGSLYKRYKQLESTLNKRNMADYQGIKDTVIPTLNSTVHAFHGHTPDHPVTANPSSRSPHIPVNKTNKGIPNDKQLKKLIRDAENKLNPEYRDKTIAREQKSMKKFFKDMGKVSKDQSLKDLRSDFWSLTPEQFAFLWNHTNFADAASMDYEIAKDHLSDKKQLADKSETFNTQIRHMKSLVNDVKRMPL